MPSLLLDFIVVILLIGTPPSVSLVPEESWMSLPDCPSCTQMKRNLSSSGQPDMVEAVKRHILNMLHLSARPNLTQPIPRAGLLNAIKKLHVGHVTEDGSVEIQEQYENISAPPEPPSEIIIFAEPGGSADTVTFDISQDASGTSVVEKASIWIFVKMSKGNRAQGKVRLQLLQQYHSGEEDEGKCISEKLVDARRSGWHTFPVPRSIQTLLDSGSRTMILHVSCPLCIKVGASPVLTSAAGQDESHRPFLMVTLRIQETVMQQRVRRGLECDGENRMCCKQQFYVNFKDIGWNDWIIAPSGYHANYCEGECPNHMETLGSSLSFHSAVISHYRLRGSSPFQNVKSCCVPMRLQAMSMLYYNGAQKIIKKDVPNMIVDECGCS